VLYLFQYACANFWLLKLHARAPKIASTTVTNQQEVLELLAVLKQQQNLFITVETWSQSMVKDRPSWQLDKT
jgi:hypothetical protein